VGAPFFAIGVVAWLNGRLIGSARLAFDGSTTIARSCASP
jgi:hypothetical protein